MALPDGEADMRAFPLSLMGGVCEQLHVILQPSDRAIEGPGPFAMTRVRAPCCLGPSAQTRFRPRRARRVSRRRGARARRASPMARSACSIWLHVISPVHVALLVVAGGLINQAEPGLGHPSGRSTCSRLWPFLIGRSAIGIPLGVVLVVKVNGSARHQDRGGSPRVHDRLMACTSLSGLRPPAGAFSEGFVESDVSAMRSPGFLGGVVRRRSPGSSGIFPAIWDADPRLGRRLDRARRLSAVHRDWPTC